MTAPVGKRNLSLLTAVLGFVAGYCDTVGFIALSGLFVAHVTGNLVLAGANLIEYRCSSVLANLLMLPTFLLAIGVLTILSKVNWFVRLETAARERCLITLQILSTLMFWMVGDGISAHAPFPLSDTVDITRVGAAGVVALAVQNAFTRLSGSTMPATTVMTGNLTQAAVSGFAWLMARAQGDGFGSTKELVQLKQLGPSVGGFFVGAAAAAPLTYLYHFDSLGLAVLALVVALVLLRRDARQSA